MTQQTETRATDMAHRVAGFIRTRLVAPVVRWHRRNELYREMMELDDHTLADIGVSRYDIPEFVRSTPVDGDLDEPSASNEDTHVGHDDDHRLAA